MFQKIGNVNLLLAILPIESKFEIIRLSDYKALKLIAELERNKAGCKKIRHHQRQG
jgi:hypothetical protein